MDRVRRFILDSAGRMGISLNELSRRIGMNQAYLSQFIDRGSPKKLREEVRRKLAVVLQCDENMLRHDDDPVEAGPIESDTPKPLRSRAGLHDVPIWRASSVGGIEIAGRDDPEGMAVRLEPLVGMGEAWACRAIDDGLAPAIQLGDTLYFDPIDPPRPGDVVCLADVGPKGTRRRLGILRALDGRHVVIGRVENEDEKITLQPHMKVGRMVGLLRR